MMAALHRSRFMRFLLIGGLATLVHVAVFTGLVEWLAVSAVLAAVPAFLSAMLFSYGGNHKWTFAADAAHHVQLPRFAAVSLAGLAINVGIMHLVVNVLGLWYGYALMAVVLMVPGITFALNRRWTFGTRPPAIACLKQERYEASDQR